MIIKEEELFMKLIVGLGNIGTEYEGTRHNIGFMVLDELAKKKGISFHSDRAFKGEIASFLEQGEKILLLKPSTYMNLSGESVRAVVDFYKIPLEDIMIVHDDLDLPCGSLRFRASGSAGGHNGLKSIFQNCGTQKFLRLKIGIGRPHPGKTVVYHVLHPFSKEERMEIEFAIQNGVEALLYWIDTSDFSMVMNRFNQKKGKA